MTQYPKETKGQKNTFARDSRLSKRSSHERRGGISIRLRFASPMLSSQLCSRGLCRRFIMASSSAGDLHLDYSAEAGSSLRDYVPPPPPSPTVTPPPSAKLRPPVVPAHIARPPLFDPFTPSRALAEVNCKPARHPDLCQPPPVKLAAPSGTPGAVSRKSINKSSGTGTPTVSPSSPESFAPGPPWVSSFFMVSFFCRSV